MLACVCAHYVCTVCTVCECVCSLVVANNLFSLLLFLFTCSLAGKQSNMYQPEERRREMKSEQQRNMEQAFEKLLVRTRGEEGREREGGRGRGKEGEGRRETLAETQTHRQIDRKINKQTDRQTKR